MISFGSYERIIVCGRLGQDAETKFTQAGKPMTSFSVAVTKYNGKDKESTTEWRNVVSFDQIVADQSSKLVKGTTVLVVGNLSTRTWTDKEGKDHFSVGVMANDVSILGGKKPEGTSDGHSSESSSKAAFKPAPAPSVVDDSDDIPF